MTLDILEQSGLLQDSTDKQVLADLLAKGPVTFYLGIDPTADSLHLGHLVPLTVAAKLQQGGHKPILVVGGATAMIGDPSGRSDERSLLSDAQIQKHIDGISPQLERLLSFEGDNAASIVNNTDWLSAMSFIEFLRDVGKYLTVNYMMAKDSVKSRLSEREQGISYTEFSYMLLQAYDFVYLAKEHGCQLQVGGSDQWGNITAGIELQRKLGGKPIYGITCPLLLDSKGEKMGKTASGARLWLDAERTSPYALYQYLVNIEDADVMRLLRQFSFRPSDEIDAIEATHAEAPHKRHGQKELAKELVERLHGEQQLGRVIAASDVLFGGSVESLQDEDLKPLLADVPSSSLPRSELERGIPLVDLLVDAKLADSKSAARRLIKGGGAYISNVKCQDEKCVVTTGDLSTESMLLLRAGRKKYHILQID